MLIEQEKKIVVIPPFLQKIFDRINKESVTKKLITYGGPCKLKGHYTIAPQLVSKIKQKVKME